MSYCQVTGASRPWSGTTPTSYLYTYLTKGGEYLGRKDVTQNGAFAATAPLGIRNWCDRASPFPYSAFSSACPPAITASNNGLYWGDSDCAMGRECLLRVRGNEGPDFPTGRKSYFQPSAIVPEVLNPAAPLCLAPDRTGGETAQFDPAPFMPNADGGSADSLTPTLLPCALDLNLNGARRCPTSFTGLVPGEYVLTVSAYQEAAGPDDANMSVYIFSPRFSFVNTYAVSNGSPAQPLYTANVTVTGTTLSVIVRFSNDWNCPTCTPADRNLRVRQVSLSRAPTNFCAGYGSSSPPRVNLRSDWYDPGQPSNPPPYADFSTQQAVRNSGWSYADGGSDIFVPMASNNLGPLQQALGLCARPTNVTSPASGGLCLSDLTTCGTGSQPCQSNDAGLPDFTPLYGSLDNALSYMRNELSTDNGSYACRDYYVLLVTDGLESTPKRYSQADLNSVVTSLRSTTTTVPGPRTKDVKTYVIGFGAGLTGDGGLTDVDIIARAGGTALKLNPNPTSLYDAFLFDNVNGKALAATNQSELGQALNWVFSTISAGRFARSRPVLSSSGGRLYQGYFERGITDGGSSPELKGNVVAFELSVSGALTRKWDYQTKLDNQASRDVRAALSAGDGGLRLVNFVASNNDVTATMDSLWGTTDAGVGVVAFIRNDTLGTGPNETYAPVVVPRRTRAGPVMFSAPTIVGPGRAEWRTGYGGNASEASKTSYQGFFDALVGRPQRVLFGSGDGLWRGVVEGDACADESLLTCANGREAWGLVPPEALRSLQTIRQGGALPVVDGTTTAADVCWPSTGSNAADCGAGEWRTVAISAMRGGGRGILAADVTDGGFPTPMWAFSNEVDDDHLGYTYSGPAIGRITVDAAGTKRWVAFMAGGLNDDSSGHDGNSFFMFDLQTGKPRIGAVVGHNDTAWPVGSDGTSFTGRTALFRPVNPQSVDVRAAYFGGTDGNLYDIRLKLERNQPDRDWKPEVFFTPRCSGGTCGGSDRARDDAKQYPGLTVNTPLWTISKTTGLQGTTGCALPLGDIVAGCAAYNVRPKFMNRPTLGMASDPSLQRPDVFIGTGDSIDVSSVAPSEQNFLFAIHDTARADASRDRPSSVNPSKTSRNDHYGQAMWAYALDVGEKVLGEPALVSGSVIFATYVPVGNGCTVLGDSYLYAFDPVTGAPRAALLNPATGTYVSVLKLAGAGPLSDLVVAANKLWFAPTRSTGSPESVDIRGANYRGVIHGWRRVR